MKHNVMLKDGPFPIYAPPTLLEEVLNNISRFNLASVQVLVGDDGCIKLEAVIKPWSESDG